MVGHRNINRLRTGKQGLAITLIHYISGVYFNCVSVVFYSVNEDTH